MHRRAILLLLLCLVIGAGRAQVLLGQDTRPTLILISFDGFRWDYRTMYSAPNINGLAARGVSADLIPSYPSKTFPNHYTIVTGLYPGHHGIVANTVKDPPTGRRLSMTNSKENAGRDVVGRRTDLGDGAARGTVVRGACSGPAPRRRSKAIDRTSGHPSTRPCPATVRVDQVLSWLDLPLERRPTFLTLYFNDVDAAGHNSGPNSTAVRTAVRRADGYLGRLLRGLERRRLTDKVNIVVVSDHGMAETSRQPRRRPR